MRSWLISPQWLPVLVVGLATSAVYAGTPEHPAAPTLRFADVETAFGQTDQLPAAQAAVAAALPIGMPLPDAQAILVRAGARCQPQRRNPEVIECVYSQRTTIDDYYAADIVWTTALHGEGARVAQISIRRELDKH